jgi:hypothetical protein
VNNRFLVNYSENPYQYEVRGWHGWYQHITLAMTAQAFLAAVCRARFGDQPADMYWPVNYFGPIF